MGRLSTEQEFLNGIGTDKVHPFIEECVFRKRPLIRVLRLICLQCITNNGLKPKILDYYKREIIQVKHFSTFQFNPLQKIFPVKYFAKALLCDNFFVD